jgi:hypothetical protein
VRRVAWLLALLSAAAAAPAADIRSSAPSDLIVTVYRAPSRGDGRFDLNNLGGFALITETRTVRLPAGESRLRFEGVADGIEPASAIVSGLPAGVIEKNRDAKLLSPSALVAQTLGKQVQLLRTNPKTGKSERRVGTIVSDNDGVVFKTDQGIEALRCSGLPETFEFDPVDGLSAHPTLSVLVRTPKSVTQQVTLSYLARGFDWSADYTATVSADGKMLDLGAWVTLANSNGVAFPSAHTQVVAGRVNRKAGQVEPIDFGGPVIAQCWPRGSTSDPPMVLQTFAAAPRATSFDAAATRSLDKKSELGPNAMVMGGAAQVQQEQLGDLKLYRVPERTTLSSRQSKQVRLMDRYAVPVTTVYGADLSQMHESSFAAYRLLRTKNSAANHLGLPLPAGSVAIYRDDGNTRQLQAEAATRDIAVDQEVEINSGETADVQVSINVEKAQADVSSVVRVQISNARAHAIAFELRMPASGRVIRADHPSHNKDGRPIFLLTIPSRQSVTLRIQVERIG